MALFPTDDGAPKRDVLTVRQLNERIQDALKTTFRGTVWVKGEIQRLPQDAARRKHIYFELHETGASGAAEYQIPVALMGWDRQRYGLARYLDGQDQDLQLANQMEVCLEAEVDFYPPFGKLSLKIVGVDKTFSLGRLEARRREVLDFLNTRGLMDKQAGLSLPALPLRIGLITAVGSAAERDFMSGIQSSGWSFQVILRGAKMQGAQLESEVMAAMAAHVRRNVDVIVITRGGGSRADLSWFDQRDLAQAIAECPVPVITAIGHEIDTSIADMVAHHACKTPTAVAEFLVARIDTAAQRIDAATQRLEQAASHLLEASRGRLVVAQRLTWVSERRLLAGRQGSQALAVRLQRLTTARLVVMSQKFGNMQNRLASRTGAVVATAGALCAGLSPRLAAAQSRAFGQAVERLNTLSLHLQQGADAKLKKNNLWLQQAEIQVRLQDPVRLLQRGYTLTLDEKGHPLKSADELVTGQVITTKFKDGSVPSIVQKGNISANRTGRPAKRKKHDRRKKEDPSQETLFR